MGGSGLGTPFLAFQKPGLKKIGPEVKIYGSAPKAPEQKFRLDMPQKWLVGVGEGLLGTFLGVLGDFWTF